MHPTPRQPKRLPVSSLAGTDVMRKLANVASNDSWPLSWRGYGSAGFICNEERHGE